MSDPIDATATLFSQLVAATPGLDVDAGFAQACRLADGLFPHQIEGVAFLLGRRRAILADDMGLGKTRQAIVALRHVAPDGPWLVVCPASLKRNWAREIRMVDPEAAVTIVEGVTCPRGTAGWTVVNYDIVARHLDVLRAAPWGGIAIDEAHYVKNQKAARSRAVQAIVDAAAARGASPAVYALTGTPLTNRPRDLFPLLQLAGHPLGRSFLSFAKRYCDAYQNDFGWVTDGASNLEELTLQLHGVMLRRTKDQVLALPPKLRAWVPTAVPPGIGHEEILRVVGLLAGARDGSPDERTRRTEVVSQLTRARRKLAVAKIPSTIEMVEDALEQGEKVIVFSCFDEPIQRVARHFGAQAVTLTGKTPLAKRQALVDRFQDDENARVFVANIIAGGTGITLTAARQVVFNDLDWVPANHWQAEDRAYRIGQRATVNVSYLVGEGTVDEFVQRMLETKAALVEAIVEGKAVTDAAFGSVLDDLARLASRLSPRLAELSNREADDQVIEELLREVAEEAHAAGPSVTQRAPLDLEATRNALVALAKVLRGPEERRFKVRSSSNPDAAYEVLADAQGDVRCSCPGFEFRGACRHARDLKTALAKGQPVPEGYEAA